VHDIISDILDWDDADDAHRSGDNQAADQMTNIENQWRHVPGGFPAEREHIRAIIQLVIDAVPAMASEDLCWAAIAAAWEAAAKDGIIRDILGWGQARKAYVAGEGATGPRYNQRLEAAARMAEIEERWHHLPGGFRAGRDRVGTHIHAVAESAPTMSREDLCWLAITAASVWETGQKSLTSENGTYVNSAPSHVSM
jgi:hypothetical protein